MQDIQAVNQQHDASRPCNLNLEKCLASSQQLVCLRDIRNNKSALLHDPFLKHISVEIHLIFDRCFYLLHVHQFVYDSPGQIDCYRNIKSNIGQSLSLWVQTPSRLLSLTTRNTIGLQGEDGATRQGKQARFRANTTLSLRSTMFRTNMCMRTC